MTTDGPLAATTENGPGTRWCWKVESALEEKQVIEPPDPPPFDLPQPESWNSSGKRSAIAASIPVGLRPAALARTGSKSTNQD